MNKIRTEKDGDISFSVTYISDDLLSIIEI